MVISPLLALLVIAILAGIAEALHVSRIRKVKHLAFGPGGGPRKWAYLAPLLAVASLSLFGWGLTSLLGTEPKVFKEEHDLSLREMNRLLIVYDVSPSMSLEDAGLHRELTRRQRSKELMDSILERVQTSQTLISIIAVYTEAKPVVIDAKDRDVIDNIFSDLPFNYAFDRGRTNLVSGFVRAAELAAEWPADSTTMLVFTDGDTIDEPSLPALPPSINNVIIAGIGPTDEGTFIDGHFSRQDVSVLNMLAQHYGGAYHNGNRELIPTDILSYLTVPVEPAEETGFSRRELAILSVVAGALIFGCLPLALGIAGSSWRVVHKQSSNDQGVVAQ